ncbi:MAG TPA: sulfotransferase [Rhodanobacteraceae bacterium]
MATLNAESSHKAALRGLAPRAAAMLADAAQRIERLDYDGAERVLTGAEALAPTHPETQRLRGLLAHRRGRHQDAEAIYRRVLAANPNDATVIGQYGDLRADAGDVDGGLMLLRHATAIAPDDPAAWLRLGILLDKRGQHPEALDVGRRIIALDPNHRLGRLLIARNLHALGDIEGTAEQYRALIALGGERVHQAWFGLVDLKTIRLDASEAAALERLALDPRHDDNARAVFNFAYGKVCEDSGRYADAFAAFARANAIVRRGIRWDAAAFSREIDETMRVFAAPIAGAPASIGGEVVFVVGLPRSSTTLIEQILAAHPTVEGASELADLPAVISAESKRRGVPHTRWMADATPADWERLGREYLVRTARWRAERPRFTDKLPNNWALIGAAHAMLPEAKFIACQRDPLETCWSCYKQLFAPGLVGYAYDLRELAAYWHDYDRLSRFWVEHYPSHVRAQSYEALLADPDTEIRALLDFCGLPFDAACLRFHESRRGVRTVSSGQVRQPLRRDTARGPRYGELLAPLRDALKAMR